MAQMANVVSKSQRSAVQARLDRNILGTHRLPGMPISLAFADCTLYALVLAGLTRPL